MIEKETTTVIHSLLLFNNSGLMTENMQNISAIEHNGTSNSEVDTAYEISRWIFIIGEPIIIIIGTIGNLLAFYVMRQGSLKRLSTCFYLSILALADTGALWIGPLTSFIRALTREEVDIEILTKCKYQSFLWIFLSTYSSSLLAIMSVEKFFALYFPLKTKNICTVKTAKWVTTILAIVFAAFDSQILIFGQVDSGSDGKYCIIVGPTENYEVLFYRIDAALYSFVPFTVITLCGSAIIYKFMLAKWQSRNEGTESTSQALNKSAYKGTAMLLTVSIMFIVLTGPGAIGFAIYNVLPDPIYSIVMILQHLNHGINGILYCTTGSKFRTQLIKMFKCGKVTNVRNITNSNQSSDSISQRAKTEMTGSYI